jgi:hypothetical protein
MMSQNYRFWIVLKKNLSLKRKHKTLLVQPPQRLWNKVKVYAAKIFFTIASELIFILLSGEQGAQNYFEENVFNSELLILI